MSDPKLGMRYEEARKKAKRFHSLGAPNVVKSLINQARLCDGEGAATEIQKEITGNVRSFSGASNSQVGIGDGEKLGEGRWQRLDNGTWVRKE